MDFARLYKAYKDYCDSGNVKALASRCWPDFFTAFGTPVCAALAMLNDLGVAAACEADTYGALSMYMCMELTSRPALVIQFLWMKKKILSLSGTVELQLVLWQGRILELRWMFTVIEK